MSDILPYKYKILEHLIDTHRVTSTVSNRRYPNYYYLHMWCIYGIFMEQSRSLVWPYRPQLSYVITFPNYNSETTQVYFPSQPLLNPFHQWKLLVTLITWNHWWRWSLFLWFSRFFILSTHDLPLMFLSHP